MRLTKMGHACVRLEKEGAALVVDPGSFTEPEATLGADGVLITHEHVDHFDVDRIVAAVDRNPGLEIWTNPSVRRLLADAGVRAHAVGRGEAFSVAGFEVGVYGEWHAVLHPDIPVVNNIGFLVDGEVFHPGDQFTVPDVPVNTLLLPTNAPWLKVSEMVDYVREVGPRRAYSVHDGLLNSNGLGIVDAFLSGSRVRIDTDARRLELGEGADLG
ncbi:MAG: MBL fold metallo-hydrolase [Streptosporangiales bacterium]|nr:MBL fold metallo-hydrolase [Streptosporangiales bacterium]